MEKTVLDYFSVASEEQHPSFESLIDTYPSPLRGLSYETYVDRLRMYLTKDEKTWTDLLWCPKDVLDTLDFEGLWSMHPKDFAQGKIGQKVVTFKRWQQSFGRDYHFTGMNHACKPTPTCLEPLLEWANGLGYTQTPLNQILINWYETGAHYIGPHRDSEVGLAREEDGGVVVVSLTLQENDVEGLRRVFRLKPIPPRGIDPSLRSKIGKEKIDITLRHGLCVVMGGHCQRTHKHQVPSRKKKFGRRINITFRCFES
jgi:alkylated DNA repair dioxygenase AlkB